MTEGVERMGRIDLKGVLITGATIEDMNRIQNLFDGAATVEVNSEDGSAIVRRAGVNKIEVAEAIEAATGITIEGLEDLRDTKKIPTKIHGKRVEDIKTRDSGRYSKTLG